jgi:hypothetical protein
MMKRKMSDKILLVTLLTMLAASVGCEQMRAPKPAAVPTPAANVIDPTQNSDGMVFEINGQNWDGNKDVGNSVFDVISFE